MTAQSVRLVKCLQCGYEWATKLPYDPRNCPNKKCGSPYWNVDPALKTDRPTWRQRKK
jgi:hypothetical protein